MEALLRTPQVRVKEKAASFSQRSLSFYMTQGMRVLLDQNFLAVPYVDSLLRFAQALAGEVVDGIGII